MSDDHIYQAINANSNKLIPTHNIDRIARQGVLFQNYFVTNSICGPSRAIILTGKHSHINQLELESLPKKVNEISGLLMMAISGGAIIPPLMGAIAGESNHTMSLFLLLGCGIVIVMIGLMNKPKNNIENEL